MLVDVSGEVEASWSVVIVEVAKEDEEEDDMSFDGARRGKNDAGRYKG